MYCIKCGVELADSERVCPLCGTAPYHPDLPAPVGESPYPSRIPVRRSINRHAPLYLITLFVVMLVVQLSVFDLRAGDGLTWSFYATGGLAFAYIAAVLPLWFRRPNPVIFVPCDFCALALYLCGINLLTGGNWYLSFAFPVVSMLGLLTSAVVTLLKYVRRGYAYIWGGTAIALGAIIVMLEFFIHITFSLETFYFWSLYPCMGCTLVGLFLIFVGICRPLREALAKKFFI
jgi:hypothetical protein